MQSGVQRRLQRCFLRRRRKTGSDGVDVTRDAATGEAGSPMADSRVRRTISDGDETERSNVEPPSPSASKVLLYAEFIDTFHYLYNCKLEVCNENQSLH